MSDNISVPSSFFTSDFAFEQQQLTFNFTGAVPATGGFFLVVGSTPTAEIPFSIFGTNATTTANTLNTTYLQPVLASLGFTSRSTLTGTRTVTSTGVVYTFKLTLGEGPNEAAIALAGAFRAR